AVPRESLRFRTDGGTARLEQIRIAGSAPIPAGRRKKSLHRVVHGVRLWESPARHVRARRQRKTLRPLGERNRNDDPPRVGDRRGRRLIKQIRALEALTRRALTLREARRSDGPAAPEATGASGVPAQ